ncbi:MAG: ParB N-terminal domain-containing protein [Myxococcaceae bacterium]
METPEPESPAEESLEERPKPAGAETAEPPAVELLPDIPLAEVDEDVPTAPGPSLPPRVQVAEAVLSRPLHVEQGLLALEQLDDDDTFRLREEGDVSRLAQDIARLGQLFPVDVRLQGERFQLVCGFRRVAALRFLQRDKVQARIHTGLSDEDALLVALAAALHAQPLSAEECLALRQRLAEEGRLGPAASDMLEQALGAGELGAEGPEQEIDADELASSLTQLLGDANQDLALLVPVFGALEEDRKAELLTQLRYAAELVAYLEES